ncbi:41719_t:CDS:1, partial [Gigaspora margarita]
HDPGLQTSSTNDISEPSAQRIFESLKEIYNICNICKHKHNVKVLAMPILKINKVWMITSIQLISVEN